MTSRRITEIRPWNLRPGDRFIVRDEIAVPARTLTFEVTFPPIAERSYFTGERVWIVPRKLVSTSDGRPCVYPGEISRVWRNETVSRVSRAAAREEKTS